MYNINNVINNNNTITSLESGNNVPNYAELQQEYGQFLTSLEDLIQNLKAYLEDPKGPNAGKEMTQIEDDLGILMTLTNPNNPNSFFGAANGDTSVIEVASFLNGVVQSMVAMFKSGDDEAILNLATSEGMSSGLSTLFQIIFHD